MSDNFDINEYRKLSEGADYTANEVTDKTTVIPVYGEGQEIGKTTVMPSFDNTTVIPVLGNVDLYSSEAYPEDEYPPDSGTVGPHMKRGSAGAANGDTIVIGGIDSSSQPTHTTKAANIKNSDLSSPTGRHTAVHEKVPSGLKPSYGAKAARVANASVSGKHGKNEKSDSEKRGSAIMGLPPKKQKKKKLSKTWIYIICVAAALLVLFITALFLGGDFEEERYNSLVTTAGERFDSGDYSGCLAYLRRAQDIKPSDEVWLMMAECYSNEQNYDKALECLRSVSEITPEISALISEADSARRALNAPESVTILDKSYAITTSAINLDGAGLTDSDMELLAQIYSLTELSIADNAVYDISALSALGGLSSLNLSGNRISDISALASLSSLRVLYLDANPINDLTPLYSLTNLTLLSVENLGLTAEQKSELSAALPNCAIHTETDIPQVHELSLGGSSFSSDCSSLTLSGCGITDISSLSACRNLKYVDLSGNEISDISPLMDIPELETLILSNNQISNIYPLMGITGLKVLYLDGNAVSTVSSLGSLKQLKELYLAGNPLCSCEGLGGLNLLETLDLTDTGLTNELLLQLNSCFSLKTLVVNDNPELTGDAVDTLSGTLKGVHIEHSQLAYPVQVGSVTILDDAEELDLENQNLSDISFLSSFKSATVVNLSGNVITNLYSLDYLKNPQRIKSLDLSNNKLTDLNGISNLTGLEELNLSGNPFTTAGQLMALTNLKELYLIGTKLSQAQILELCNALPNCNIHYE